jgi:hypothetical protein
MEAEGFIIETARAGVDFIERERRRLGYTQERISELAHPEDVRKHYPRMCAQGETKLSDYIRYARAAGYNVVLIKREDA